MRRFRKREVDRRIWVRPWIRRRNALGAHHALLSELRNEDQTSFKNFVRMDPEAFDELLELVTPLIKRRDTWLRDAIPAAERLSLTLRFLATGESYESLAYLYRIPKQTLSYIIPETCDAIYKVLKDTYMKVPATTDEWENIAKEFEDRWNFPNCIGAIDGKHITIRCPVASGSKFFNYKGYFSIVLLAIVDADYKFTYVDVGCNGRVSDGGIFAQTAIHNSLENSKLSIPTPKPLPGREDAVPYVIVGDEAFPLKSYLMKPYPSRQLDCSKRIFNYRLSRARRIVENAFGILSSRFGIFRKPMALEADKVEKVVLAACSLHNFLRTKSTRTYMPFGSIDREDEDSVTIIEGEWRSNHVPNQNFLSLSNQGGNRSATDIRDIRSEFCDYFNTNGAVPWQWHMI